jgi:hypothetical protein
MVNYRVDPMWGQPCSAYHLQCRFTDAALRDISVIQDKLENVVGGLRRVPPSAMHLTVITLLHPQPGLEADEVWARSRERWADSLLQVCASAQPVSLSLDTVRAFDTAIVLMTANCASLQTLRSAIVKDLALPSAGSVPQIAHTSLFRYGNLDIAEHERPESLVSADALDIQISEILLVHETKYPSLESEILGRFRLAACR